MTHITLMADSFRCKLDASVEQEIITLLSGEGSKSWFSAEEAAEQISCLIDIEAELNGWQNLKINFTGESAVASLLEAKLCTLGYTAFYLSGYLKVA